MKPSFISYITKSYMIIGILLLAILIVFIQGTENYLSLLNFILIFTYGYFLHFCSERDDTYFTNVRLFFTVFFYSLILVLLYYSLSLHYKNDIMVFCYSDASLYFETVKKMFSDDDIQKAFQRISRWKYDDWGAPFSMLLFYNIIPSKVFVNFVYIIIGTISSVSLYEIGKKIMSVKYAYIAALSFGISSYWIWFHSSFLKETVMLFIIIESFYFFYKFLESEYLVHLILAIAISLLLIFFRPALIGFIWVACSSYFIFNSSNRTLWLFYLFLIVVVFYFFFPYMKDIFDNYTHSGNVETIKTYIGATQFSIATNTVAALIGPFPNLVSTQAEIAYKHLYATGLLFKYMLFVPFWYGLFVAFKHKMYELFPLFLFCTLEIFSLIYINNGLVLRKAMPHVPIFILCAIWAVSLYDNRETESNSRFLSFTKLSWIIVMVSTIVWNTLK